MKLHKNPARGHRIGSDNRPLIGSNRTPGPAAPTTTALALRPQAGLAPFVQRPDLEEDARVYAAAAEAPATVLARESDWRVFAAWCAQHGQVELPATADTAAAFLVDQARTHALASLLRFVATIGKVHKLRGLPSPVADPVVKQLVKGMRRKKGVRGHQVDAFSADLALRGAPEHAGARQIRDRALLLVGLATAMRRAELCAMTCEQLAWRAEGVAITLGRSKTDQEGVGRLVALPRLLDAPEVCPVRALEAWLELLPARRGPVFRGLTRSGAPRPGPLTTRHVALIVQRAAAAAGADPARFAGHSLRAGYVTAARLQGQDWRQIMEQTGHRKLETVRKYSRCTQDPFKATGAGDVLTQAFAQAREQLELELGTPPAKGRKRAAS